MESRSLVCRAMMRPEVQDAFDLSAETDEVRRKYGVTVVGVKRAREDFVPGRPETAVQQGDLLIVSGPTKLVEAFAAAGIELPFPAAPWRPTSSAASTGTATACWVWRIPSTRCSPAPTDRSPTTAVPTVW